MLIASSRGNYGFLKGIYPYSSGVIADPGHEIIHVTLREALPWREGFEAIEAHLRSAGRERHALCGMELRSPAPFTMRGFIEFNQQYCRVLEQWDLYVDGLNPVARTHVAPLHQPPEAPVLHGFSYTMPGAGLPPTLVIAGAGELREGLLVEEGILCRGRTDARAMQEKAAYVLEVMKERLAGLGGDWGMIQTVDVYTAYPLAGIEAMIWERLGEARRHGFRWYQARPPVVDIEFEMDMRGTRTELYV